MENVSLNYERVRWSYAEAEADVFAFADAPAEPDTLEAAGLDVVVAAVTTETATPHAAADVKPVLMVIANQDFYYRDYDTEAEFGFGLA